MRARRRNASKRSVRKRVSKALTKYVRGNPHRGKQSMRKFKKLLKGGQSKPRMTKADWREIQSVLGSDAGPGVHRKANPPRVKGRKVKGGRAVTLRNFTGTIVKKSDGTVGILGRGRRK